MVQCSGQSRRSSKMKTVTSSSISQWSSILWNLWLVLENLWSFLQLHMSRVALWPLRFDRWREALSLLSTLQPLRGFLQIASVTLCNQFPCMCMYSNLPKLDVECSRSSYCNWEKLKRWNHLQIDPYHSSCSSCSWQVEMTQCKYFQKVLLYIPQIYEQCKMLCALPLWKAMLPLRPFFALKNEAKWEAPWLPSVFLALCTVSHFVQCGLFAHFARSSNFSFTVARSQVAWTMQPTQCPAQCPPGKKRRMQLDVDPLQKLEM